MLMLGKNVSFSLLWLYISGNMGVILFCQYVLSATKDTCSATNDRDCIFSKDVTEEGVINKGFRKYHFRAKKVPRLSKETPLANRLISSQQPVVIKDSKLTESAQNWTIEFLRDNIGNGNFRVCLSKNHRFQYFNEEKLRNVNSFMPQHKRIDVPFKTFYSMLTNWKEGQPRVYLQERLKQGVSSAMHKDFSNFNWQWINEQRTRNNWKDMATNLLLIAQEGSLTPAHYDEQENFLAQIAGTKKVIFFSPAQFENLYPYPFYHPCDRQSQVDLEQPDFIRFPKAANLEAYEAIIHPGDVVYIPPFWWHQVESSVGEGPTTSLTFWYESPPFEKIEYPLTAPQRVTMMRNVEKMMLEALNFDGTEVSRFFRDLTVGRHTELPIHQ